MSRFLKVSGISRAPDDGDPRRRKVLQVHFNHEPTGEQMNEFMAYALAFMTAEQREAKPREVKP